MGKLTELLAHPEEWSAVAKMLVASKQAARLPSNEDLAFCYGVLNQVSRSFAVVIQQLPNPLRDAICVFYLVLRGLDTVEDDMAIPVATKVPQLLAFHKNIYKRGFSLDCGYGPYKPLMARFGTVVDVFLALDPGFQGVIADITRRMGEGMAEFIEREVVTEGDYDLYCHYVAGLVGIGLSQLFASSGLEDDSFADAEELSNHMGLFLQKTNIIRDYLEDINEQPAPRMFWPRDIWGEYADELEDFTQPANRPAAVQCLNHLVVNALQHLPHCVSFMAGLRHRDVFRFCAIPQIMSIGTLSLLYNNGDVYEGVVKMRRGLTARVFNECDGMGDLLRWFVAFLADLQATALLQVAPDDPSRQEMLDAVAASLALCQGRLAKLQAAAPRVVTARQRGLDLLLLLLAGTWFFAAWGMGARAGGASLPGGLAWPEQLLPAQYAGLEQALATMLLLSAMARVMMPLAG